MAELSTRQIAEATDATGLADNTTAAHAGGGIAKQARKQLARKQLESKTGKPVVSGQNYLAPKGPAVAKPTKTLKASKK